MADQRHVQKPAAEIASLLILKFKTPLLIALAGMAAVIVIYFVLSERERTLNERSAKLVEEVQELYLDWLASDPKDEELDRLLLERTDHLIDSYRGRYAAQRAWFIKANRAFALESWEQAVEAYLQTASSNPKSYLAAISLFNAGSALEEAGRPEEAYASYLRISEEYPASHLAPQALFAAGRIRETNRQFQDAFDLFVRVEDEYGASAWAVVARNRIIYLRVHEYLEEG